MERLHVKAWPPFETATVDGWLWRYSGGGSKRANSTSTLEFTGTDPASALQEVEARYLARNAPAQLQTFDASRPADIADLLVARRYREVETTLTMMKRIEIAADPADVDVLDGATAEWLEVYLGAITQNRRAVNARILERIPKPRAFFACRRHGQIISTALAVADGDMAVVECMATRAESRRQRGADAVLRALECWAVERGVRTLGLQVVATNAPAVRLYGRIGFAPVATNRFWVRLEDK